MEIKASRLGRETVLTIKAFRSKRAERSHERDCLIAKIFLTKADLASGLGEEPTS